MDEEQPVSRISRRKALKRIGAGAAVAWSAPVLSSLRTPAFAAGTPACADPCRDDCSDGTISARCGATGPAGICACSVDVTGKCFCWEDDFCDNRPDATTGCPAGQTAVSTCCDQSGFSGIKCWDPCGTNPAPSSQGVTSGPRGSGA